MIPPRRPRGDAGETLLELVISIMILGISVVAIGSSIAVGVKLSAIHRNQAVADDYLHNYAEKLQTSYTACTSTTSPNYASTLTTAVGTPTGFSSASALSAGVKYWNASSASFSSASCPATDPGLQQVTLTLTSDDQLVSESLVVTVRNAT